ncbi:hypothetical protein GCM10010269_26240 [Streptomyces humidus]|uniref:Uncharacterized protein n=1 Tax=Streptomyces humidus TaxID=52259 RepID=A0A918L333_9ACTN|nr:hypothetical protein GCM10010269_26240 [Streptomyces humidus]
MATMPGEAPVHTSRYSSHNPCRAISWHLSSELAVVEHQRTEQIQAHEPRPGGQFTRERRHQHRGDGFRRLLRDRLNQGVVLDVQRPRFLLRLGLGQPP